MRHGVAFLGGDGVKFDSKEFLRRSQGPTVGRMLLLATCGLVQGYFAHEKRPPPRPTIRPYA